MDSLLKRPSPSAAQSVYCDLGDVVVKVDRADSTG